MTGACGGYLWWLPTDSSPPSILVKAEIVMFLRPISFLSFDYANLLQVFPNNSFFLYFFTLKEFMTNFEYIDD